MAQPKVTDKHQQGREFTCTRRKSSGEAEAEEALSIRTPLAQLGFCHMPSALLWSSSQSGTLFPFHAVMMTCSMQGPSLCGMYDERNEARHLEAWKWNGM